MATVFCKICESVSDNKKKLKEIIGSFDGNSNLKSHDHYIEDMDRERVKLVGIDDASLYWDTHNGTLTTELSIEEETITLIGVIYTNTIGLDESSEFGDIEDDSIETVW